MSDTKTEPKLPAGQRTFSSFSWPGGEIPPVLSGKPIPLKVGFAEEARAMLPGSEHEEFQVALARWTRGYPYRYALTLKGAKRHDFDGSAVEEVNGQHRAHALASIEMQQVHKMKRRRAQMLSCLHLIDKALKEPTQGKLDIAKKASDEMRQLLDWKLEPE